MTSKSYKSVQRETTLLAAISDAYAELQVLRDEVVEWKDNMESNNMEHLPKYDEVSECANALDGIADEEPAVPDQQALRDTKIVYSELVNRRKGKHPGRAVRHANAMGMLQAVVDHLGTLAEDEDNLPDDIQSLRDDLVRTIDEGESVDYPGMF